MEQSVHLMIGARRLAEAASQNAPQGGDAVVDPGQQHSRDEFVNIRNRRWVFTWHEPPEEWKVSFTNDIIKPLIKYLISEEEFCPSTGRKHIQGYVHFTNKMYYTTLRRMVPCFWEVAKGTELDNYRYCTKTGRNILEIGQRLSKTEEWISKKERLLKMQDDLMKKSWNEFEEIWPIEAFNQRKKLEEYKIRHMKISNDWNGNLQEKNYWIWGPPGTGKSRWARSQGERDEIYPKNVNKWWGGIQQGQHRIVLIEDFPQDGRPYVQLMKIWSDRYNWIGEVKNGEELIDPGKFFLIITSNYSIEEVFPGTDAEAIRRRFKEVKINGQNDLFLQTRLNRNILTQ